MRTEPCACGGMISVQDGQSPMPYVEAHNSTFGHVVWRRVTGPSRERPTATWPACDLSSVGARASAAAARGRAS